MAPDALTSQQAKGLAQLAELTDRDGWVEPPKACDCRNYLLRLRGAGGSACPVKAELQPLLKLIA